MKRMVEKLNNTHGASILFALLVFLLCAFAGAAALTAAAANAGRFSHAERDQQQYLSVVSAADLLLEELASPRLEITRTCRETRAWEYDAGNNLINQPPVYVPGDTVVKWYDGDTELTGDFMLKALVEAYCEGLFEADVVPADWYKPGPPPGRPACEAKKLTISAHSDNLKNKLDDVYISVALDPETYALTVNLWVGDEADALADEAEPRRVYNTEIRLPAVTAYNMESTVIETSGSGSQGWTVTETKVVFTLEWPSDGALMVRN